MDGIIAPAEAIADDPVDDRWPDVPPTAVGERTRDLLGDQIGPPIPAEVDWLRSVFRLSRSNGSRIFEGRERAPARLATLERWVRRVGDPHLARVVGGWRPSSPIGDEVEGVAPPLPSHAWPGLALAVLRPGWTRLGDCVAIDHRRPGPTTRVEVAGRGATWLGPSWTSPTPAGAVEAARPTYWTTGAYADAVEWSFAAGPATVTRTAVLIRGGHLAILLQTEVGAGPGPGEARWSLPVGIEARPDLASRALILSAGRGRPSARLIPLGLPAASYPTDRGELVVEGREAVLRQRADGPNRCLALLVSWRRRPPTGWRTLTVAERSAACPPGTAFAARVGWGGKQAGLLVYRSLGSAGLRSVLGHQTRARLVVGAYDHGGDVHPWIKATDPAAPVG